MADPVGPIEIDGLALDTFGFVGEYVAATEGLGLNTFGFLWPTNGIWVECAQCADGIATVWTECEGC